MILSWRSQAETLILALLLLSDDKSFHRHQLRGGRACTVDPNPGYSMLANPGRRSVRALVTYPQTILVIVVKAPLGAKVLLRLPELPSYLTLACTKLGWPSPKPVLADGGYQDTKTD